MEVIPLKKAIKTDVSGPVTKYLKKMQGRKVSVTTLDSVNKIQKQRDIIMTIQTYKGKNDISDYKCYLNYLDQLDKVIPMSGDKCVEVDWSWTDSFNGKKNTVSDIIFEKAAVMFNIASLYTQAAFEQYNVEEITAEKLAMCIDNLSNAALYFHELNKQYSLRMDKLKVSMDISKSVLDTLESMTMAQGQHMYFLKARVMEMPPQVMLVLQKTTSDMYFRIKDDAKKCGKYFPDGFIKHFELMCYLTTMGALHYYGEDLLRKNDPEANSGELFKLANHIDDLEKETTKLMSSFHVASHDVKAAEQVMKMIKEDKKTFWTEYKIYGGPVPETLTIPNGIVKMTLAQDLKLPDIPLTFEMPENTNVSEALGKFQIELAKKKDEIVVLSDTKTKEIHKILCDLLLPEILTAEGFASNLPMTMVKRINSIRGQGSIAKLKSDVDAIEKRYIQIDEKKNVIKSQVQVGNPFYELVDWADRNLRNFKVKQNELSGNTTKMMSKPIIFNDVVENLIANLPSCPGYPEYQANMSMKNACDEVMNLLTSRQTLLNSLFMDRSGEAIVRSSVMADGNLLNLQMTIFKAMSGVDRIIQQIKDNIDVQSHALRKLNSEYKTWNKQRKVTKDMEKRENALRDVNLNLNMYDESCTLRDALSDALERIESSLKDVCEQMGIS